MDFLIYSLVQVSKVLRLPGFCDCHQVEDLWRWGEPGEAGQAQGASHLSCASWCQLLPSFQH